MVYVRFHILDWRNGAVYWLKNGAICWLRNGFVIVLFDVVCVCEVYVRIHIVDWRNGSIYGWTIWNGSSRFCVRV